MVSEESAFPSLPSWHPPSTTVRAATKSSASTLLLFFMISPFDTSSLILQLSRLLYPTCSQIASTLLYTIYFPNPKITYIRPRIPDSFPRNVPEKIKILPPGNFNIPGRQTLLLFFFYPSMEIVFFCSTAGFASFFGTKSFSRPCLNSALISSSVISSPT